jgi:hypothetical protein
VVAEREELCVRIAELESQLQGARRKSLMTLRQPRNQASTADSENDGLVSSICVAGLHTCCFICLSCPSLLSQPSATLVTLSRS